MCYPANTLAEPIIIVPKSAPSPLRETGLPCAKTERDPPHTTAGCPTHLSGQHTGIVWGSNGSPGLSTADPFANTERCVALQTITLVHPWPVAARSLRSLDIAGIVLVFIAVGNRSYYSLNLVLAGELSAWGGLFFQASNTELTFGAFVVFSLITCDFKGWIEITVYACTPVHYYSDKHQQ